MSQTFSGLTHSRDLKLVLGVAAVAVVAVAALFAFVPTEPRAFSAIVPFHDRCDPACSPVLPLVLTAGGSTSLRITGSWSVDNPGGVLMFEVRIGTVSSDGCYTCGTGYTAPVGSTSGSFSVARAFGDPGSFSIIVIGTAGANSTTNVTATVYSLLY